MAKTKEIIVKETLKELQILKRSQPHHLQSRIQMLIAMKRSKVPYTKDGLAQAMGISGQTAHTWRTNYLKKGIEGLLKFDRTHGKPSLVNEKAHKAIEQKLTDPKAGMTSYTELQQWVSDQYLPDIKYTTLNEYVKRKFGAKLKVARKSHINKDEAAIELFKKTS